MAWLYLNESALWLMASGKNTYLSKRSYPPGKPVNIPSDWFQRQDAPGQMIVMMDGKDPIPYEAPAKEAPSAPSLPNQFLKCIYSGQKDGAGFKVFKLDFVSDGKVVDSIKMISGTRTANSRDFVHPKKDYSGSGNPIPEGAYNIGNIIKMSSAEPGVGYVKIPLEPLPEFRLNNRSELLLHNDYNHRFSPGSLGCLVTYNSDDMAKIVSWCSQQARPSVLIVDYGFGVVSGSKYSLGKLEKVPTEVAGGSSESVYPKALGFVLQWEGGYVNDPHDKGGATNKGITQGTYNAYRRDSKLAQQTVKNITDAEVAEIYRKRYWLAAHCHELPPKLAVCVFDWHVNSGRGISTLQSLVGADNDGIWGPKTGGAVKAFLIKHGEAQLVERYLDFRENKYRAWATGNQAKFLQGWLNRLNALRKLIPTL